MHGPATGPGYQSRSGLREASSKRGRSSQINGTAAGREEAGRSPRARSWVWERVNDRKLTTMQMKGSNY